MSENNSDNQESDNQESDNQDYFKRDDARHPLHSDRNPEPEKFVVEIPPEKPPTYQEKLPSGFDPMGEIYLRGHAYRGLAGGTQPWWVIISGWFIFGGIAFMIIGAAISSLSPMLIIPFLFALIPVIILWRGTTAKLANRKSRRR
jgi:hypothetical protein